MRGLHTQVSTLRKNVFVEVARIAFEESRESMKEAIEDLPYKLSPGEVPLFRENIYRERAISAERARLAMGLSIRPQNKPVHTSSGMEESTIDEIYYEPPLMQVIPSACNECEDNVYEVSNLCRDCIAHQCMEMCPKDAITHVDGQAFIDQDKCIKCGRCKSACPYDAIGKRTRPCSLSCGVKAIGTDEYGRAKIDQDKCLSCGMCMVNCPFGAIADKSQFFQLILSLRKGQEVVAEIAPAYVGQFGAKATPSKIHSALKALGFSQVYEVALGADMGALAEAKTYATKVQTGELPFLLTSCCPSWAMLAKTQFPEIIDNISTDLTPMVATARSIKKEHPNAKVVFIGPCAAKKLEAMRHSVRSDVDFVITFEELDAMFEAKGIHPEEIEETSAFHDATAVGRGYGVAGGVADAITKCVQTYYPGVETKIEHAEGLADCKKMLLLAKAGKMNGCLIEGMGCPGGCVAGAGTLLPVQEAKKNVQKIVADSTRKVPRKELEQIELK